MNNVQGAFFSYKDFRQSLDRQPIKPRVWRCSELGDMRQTLEASDVDIVALAHDNTLEGCQLTPGMAVSMQWLVPGSTLTGHAHAWWHLFIIQSGSQTYFTFDLGHRADGTSHFPHHQHVKAIRAKINCSI